MKILVTGGLGYIGSHTAVALQNRGYKVIIVDNLANSRREVVDNIGIITGNSPCLEVFDLCCAADTRDFFSRHKDIKGVIHFAAHKAVGESVANPLKYYGNNIISLLNILQGMDTIGCSTLVFSSSCTVYGQPEELPVSEEAPVQKAFSPYGNTKQISEEIITDHIHSQSSGADMRAVLLRYFNPIGAHDSAHIGELPLGVPDNLVPYITQTASGKRDTLKVFGNDYNTHDGTAIRDYIHVMDLAGAHVKALDRMLNSEHDDPVEIFNLGTGTGYSVLDVIKAFEKVSGKPLNFCFAPRRPGDVEKVWANPEKANKILQWKATRTLNDMMKSAWEWEKKC